MVDGDRSAVLVASNRGPVAFVDRGDGEVELRRGGGGLVSGLVSATSTGSAVWVCAALSEADRAAAAQAPGGRLDRAGHDTGGVAVRMLDIDATTFHRAYNAIANSVLWFVNHQLYDTPNQPVFDRMFLRQWSAYERYNDQFAAALDDEAAEGAAVIVQDYHLTLTPRLLRDRRPDLRIGHFTHTPWAAPSYFSLLPDRVATGVLTGMLGADHVGFLSPRWAARFLDCCEQVLGACVDRSTSTVRHDGRRISVGVHALGVDGPALRERAHQPDVDARLRQLRHRIGHRAVLLRIDRTELSKNIVRGLLAYREFLRAHPQWHGRVVHLAFAYPSRHDLPEYREYTAAVQRTAKEIEEEFADGSWSPIVLEVNDDYPRSLAAYRIADAAIVNPIRDGMNLVAKEAPVLSERGVALVLSRECGAADELGDSALVVNPYDVTETAEAIATALAMSEDERRQRTERLTAAATKLPPAQWLAQQLDALP